MRRRAVGARGIDCIPFSDRCKSVPGRCGKNSYFSRSEKDTQSIPRETLRGPGRPSQLPPPIEGYTEGLGPQERTILDQVLSCASIGTPEMVRADLHQFVKHTGADELMITSQIFDHAARLRSFEIAAEAFADVPLDRIA